MSNVFAAEEYVEFEVNDAALFDTIAIYHIRHIHNYKTFCCQQVKNNTFFIRTSNKIFLFAKLTYQEEQCPTASKKSMKARTVVADGGAIAKTLHLTEIPRPHPA